MPNPSIDLLQQYDDEVLSAVDDRRQRKDGQQTVKQAVETTIYGGLISKYLDAAIGVAKDGKVESAVEPDKATLAGAVDFISRAAVRSEAEYARTRPTFLEDPGFRREIDDLQVSVSMGIIRLMSDRFAMTREEGRNQVDFADTAFSSLGQRAQLLMAGLNYATFTGKTMLTGNALISDSEQLDLNGWTEKQMQQSMPHLVISNMAIGQIVSALLQRGKVDESFNIVDTGSGTGCTLAGSVLGVQDAAEKGSKNPRISMTGIEGGRKFFYDELVPFADAARGRMPDVSLDKTVLTKPSQHTVEGGQFNLIYGDILDSLKQLEFGKEVKNGVTVITANYVWHRLPRVVKDAMIKEITRKAPNAIFLVADLVQNASEVNRRYFDFRDNGLLNCGNVGLDNIFKSNGYRMFELNGATAPKSMDQRLAQQIGKGTTSDSIFYVAYRGEKAADLVENW